MKKQEDEKIWGVSLSLATRDLTMATSIITHTCKNILDRLGQLGDEKERTPEYQRLRHLLSMTGGIKYMLEGADACLQGLVLDLLDDFREEDRP